MKQKRVLLCLIILLSFSSIPAYAYYQQYYENFDHGIPDRILWQNTMPGPTPGTIVSSTIDDTYAITTDSYSGKYALNVTRRGADHYGGVRFRMGDEYTNPTIAYWYGWMKLTENIPTTSFLVGGITTYSEDDGLILGNSGGTVYFGLKTYNGAVQWDLNTTGPTLALEQWAFVVVGVNSTSDLCTLWVNDTQVLQKSILNADTIERYFYGLIAGQSASEPHASIILDDVGVDLETQPTMPVQNSIPLYDKERVNTTIVGVAAKYSVEVQTHGSPINRVIIQTNNTGVSVNTTYTSLNASDSSVDGRWLKVEHPFTVNTTSGNRVDFQAFAYSETVGSNQTTYSIETTPALATNSLLYFDGMNIKKVSDDSVITLTGGNYPYMLDSGVYPDGSWVVYGGTEGGQAFSTLAVNQTLDMMSLWRMNTVRLLLNIQGWKDLAERATYISNIKEICKQAENRSMYVVLSPWSVDITDGQGGLPYPPDNGANGTAVLADEDAVVAWWGSVAEELKDCGTVIYDTYNEPQAMRWSYKSDGSLNKDMDRWLWENQRYIDEIRRYVDAPVFVEVSYGEDMLWVLWAREMLDGPNIGYSGHLYSNNNFDNQNARTKPQIQTHLISDHYYNVTQTWCEVLYVGEWGHSLWAVDQTAEALKWRYVLEYMRDWNISWCEWNWRGSGTQWDMTSGTGFPQDPKQPMGRWLWNITSTNFTDATPEMWLFSAGSASIDAKNTGAYYLNDITATSTWYEANKTLSVTPSVSIDTVDFSTSYEAATFGDDGWTGTTTGAGCAVSKSTGWFTDGAKSGNSSLGAWVNSALWYKTISTNELYVLTQFNTSGWAWSDSARTIEYIRLQETVGYNLNLGLGIVEVGAGVGNWQLRFYNDTAVGLSTYTNATALPVADTAYKLKVHIKTGNGDGEVQGWIDDVLTFNYTGLENDDPNGGVITRLSVGQNMGDGNNAVTNALFDETQYDTNDPENLPPQSGYIYVFPDYLPDYAYHYTKDGQTFYKLSPLIETDNYLIDIPIDTNDTVKLFDGYFYPYTVGTQNTAYAAAGNVSIYNASWPIREITYTGGSTFNLTNYVPATSSNTITINTTASNGVSLVEYANGTNISFDYYSGNNTARFTVTGSGNVSVIIYLALPPNAPSWYSPANDTRYDPSDTVTLYWNFTDPDPGASQSAYEVELDNDVAFGSPEVDTGKTTSGNEYYLITLPGGIDLYYIRVRTWDDVDIMGAWNESKQIIVDRVDITLTAVDDRINVGATGVINTVGVFNYDGTPWAGVATLNDTLTKATVDIYWYTTASITDPTHGLSGFLSGNESIIFDQVIINTLTVNDAAPEVGDTVTFTATASLRYDGHVLNGSAPFLDTLTLRTNAGQNIAMTYNGLTWTGTHTEAAAVTRIVNTPGAVDETTYDIDNLSMNGNSVPVTWGVLYDTEGLIDPSIEILIQFIPLIALVFGLEAWNQGVIGSRLLAFVILIAVLSVLASAFNLMG